MYMIFYFIFFSLINDILLIFISFIMYILLLFKKNEYLYPKNREINYKKFLYFHILNHNIINFINYYLFLHIFISFIYFNKLPNII